MSSNLSIAADGYTNFNFDIASNCLTSQRPFRRDRDAHSASLLSNWMRCVECFVRFLSVARDHESHIYILNWLVTEININFNSFSTLKIGDVKTVDVYSTLSNYKFVDALQTCWLRESRFSNDVEYLHSPLRFVARATSPNCLLFTFHPKNLYILEFSQFIYTKYVRRYRFSVDSNDRIVKLVRVPWRLDVVAR